MQVYSDVCVESVPEVNESVPASCDNLRGLMRMPQAAYAHTTVRLELTGGREIRGRCMCEQAAPLYSQHSYILVKGDHYHNIMYVCTCDRHMT